MKCSPDLLSPRPPLPSAAEGSPGGQAVAGPGIREDRGVGGAVAGPGIREDGGVCAHLLLDTVWVLTGQAKTTHADPRRLGREHVPRN